MIFFIFFIIISEITSSFIINDLKDLNFLLEDENDDIFNHPYEIEEINEIHYMLICNQDDKSIFVNIIALESKKAILPSIISLLTKLKELSAHQNNLMELPMGFEKLTSLEFLDLSFNKFSRIPNAIFSLRSLKKLRLDKNPIYSIPRNIMDLNNLEELSFRDCNIIYISKHFFPVPSLKLLDLSSNPTLFLIKSNESLHSKAQIATDQHPDYNPQHTNFKPHTSYDQETKNVNTTLEILKLNSNNLTDYPKIFENCLSLESLYLISNKITIFPKFIFKLEQLILLEMRDNLLSSLYIDNLLLPNLKHLNLGKNQLINIYISPTAMPNLEALHLCENKIPKLHESVLNRKNLCDLCIWLNVFVGDAYFPSCENKITTLTICFKDKTSIPSIFLLNLFNTLNISCESKYDLRLDILKHVPINFELKTLSLWNCSIKEIPRNIYKLVNLKILQMQHNQITRVHNFFQKNKYLEVLDLSHNRIIIIDGSILQLETLKELNFSHNTITFLPSTFYTVQVNFPKVNLESNPLIDYSSAFDKNRGILGYKELPQEIKDNLILNHTDQYWYNYHNFSGAKPSPADFFYGTLSIPNKTRINFEMIQSAIDSNPPPHTKSMEEMLQNLNGVMKLFITDDIENKVHFLKDRIINYYDMYDENFNDNYILFNMKKFEILSYLECIFISFDKMSQDISKHDELRTRIEALFYSLGYGITNENGEHDLKCYTGQGQAFFHVYQGLADNPLLIKDINYYVKSIIANLKNQIFEKITGYNNEPENVEIYVNWRNEMANDLGFNKIIGVNSFISGNPLTFNRQNILTDFFLDFNRESMIEGLKEYYLGENNQDFREKIYDFISNNLSQNKCIDDYFKLKQDDKNEWSYSFTYEGAELILRKLNYIF
ncbi:Leucine rich repeat protein [Spraguea lophii 42_110]|uniref:Leucine rich repeat protein n=1 Tax=Spraguea lophii (strain 42_110) TaxID=1358809 RepID=S7WCB0_SPRLO|nr:Leucine rich repeat protein [Spraguea lophii 42_110]